MSELRQNTITKDWVVIAPERSKRPDQYKHSKVQDKQAEQDVKEKAACPFCPGNESKCDEAVLT